MADFLYSIDLSIFYFINHSLQNLLFDGVMPFVTDLNKKPGILALVAIGWVVLFIKGGAKGRTVALLLIPTIVFSDQLNSGFIKSLFERLRPCHTLPDVHLLVPCGSGYSFPSSHAVNNFAGAFVVSYFYRTLSWAMYGFAAVVSFSRVYVGVHYPSDVVVGALVGIGCGALVIVVFEQGRQWWKTYRSGESKQGGKE